MTQDAVTKANDLLGLIELHKKWIKTIKESSSISFGPGNPGHSALVEGYGAGYSLTFNFQEKSFTMTEGSQYLEDVAKEFAQSFSISKSWFLGLMEVRVNQLEKEFEALNGEYTNIVND